MATKNYLSFVSTTAAVYVLINFNVLVNFSIKTDFLLLQEHWPLNNELSIFNLFPSTLYHGCSGMSDAEILTGRPFGEFAY